jgi:hypothetical protein
MTTATIEDKKGRGRPRTRPLHRVDSGVYETKDGRYRLEGSGKRGRKQEWIVIDTTIPDDSPVTNNTIFSSLSEFLTWASNHHSASIN